MGDWRLPNDGDFDDDDDDYDDYDDDYDNSIKNNKSIQLLLWGGGGGGTKERP